MHPDRPPMLYSPVSRGEDGAVTVGLGEDHPGFRDADYRARRNALASLALDWKAGQPIPHAEYTDVENEVWHLVCRELADKHRTYATGSFLDSVEALGLPTDRIPQLSEVTDRLGPLADFSYVPVAGLAPLREFYGSFEDGVFHSTQYIRHHSSPRYTPEPDILHEVVGHANQLADPRVARLYRKVGQAVKRVQTDDALRFLSKVFWFTFEFGVVEEDGELKTYGAGILSSFGELDAFRSAEIRPIDFAEMGTLEYDITRYQPVLYSARSMEEAFELIEDFLDGYTDDTPARLAG